MSKANEYMQSVEKKTADETELQIEIFREIANKLCKIYAKEQEKNKEHEQQSKKVLHN